MLDDSPLGKATAYPDRYDPSLLFALGRSIQRDLMGLREPLPFTGIDIWTAYEISWLNPAGTPQLAIGEMRVPANSPAIVESKSLKLYLGSFAQEPVASRAELTQTLKRDLARVCGVEIGVELIAPSAGACLVSDLPGESIDGELVDGAQPRPTPTLLSANDDLADEALCSALFRSNCPVTGQPDYADVLVRYRGPRIDRAGLLRYLISYRRHAAFHENCVERIFVDVTRECHPQQLTVYARFTRRGGIDINPFRSNFESAPARTFRTPRQ
jgi:7-cyano-7-deazaguanine reductase